MLFALVWILVCIGSFLAMGTAVHFLGMQSVMFMMIVYLVVRSFD